MQTDVQQAIPYEVARKDAMSLIVGSVLLQKHFPIIGISETNHATYLKELQELGVISDHAHGSQVDSAVASRASDDTSSSHACYQLTAFGKEVARHSLDLHVGILVAVCARCDLPWHGRIAAAYIQAAQDCFRRTPTTATCGLHPDQITAGHKAGDERTPSVLHTTIYTYLCSVAANRVPDKRIFSGRWVNRIHDILNRGMASSSGAEFAGALTVDLAEELKNSPNWEAVVTLAVAWAFPDHVAINLGDGKFRMNVKLTLATFKCS